MTVGYLKRFLADIDDSEPVAFGPVWPAQSITVEHGQFGVVIDLEPQVTISSVATSIIADSVAAEILDTDAIIEKEESRLDVSDQYLKPKPNN